MHWTDVKKKVFQTVQKTNNILESNTEWSDFVTIKAMAF